MTLFDWFAQVFGIVGMTFNITSFLQKDQKKIFIFQFFGALFFTISFFMLGAHTGASLNLVAAIRAIIYINKGRLHAERKRWVGGFFFIYILVYVATFTLFGEAMSVKNILVEILPVIAMTVATFSFSLPKAKHVRLFALISSPLWLIYNVISHSVGGVLCESFSIVSALVGFFYHDRVKNQ